MAITNAQQAKQLMNEGGPMRKIKGQDHMLAYITQWKSRQITVRFRWSRNNDT